MFLFKHPLRQSTQKQTLDSRQVVSWFKQIPTLELKKKQNGLCPKMWHTRRWWQTIIYDFGRTLQTWTTHMLHMLLWYATWTNMILRGKYSKPLHLGLVFFKQANLWHLPNNPTCLCTGGCRTKTQPGYDRLMSSRKHGFPQKIPSGEHTKSNGKWPFIVDFPIKTGDFPLLC